MLKWAIRIIGALLLAALVVGVWKRDEITRLFAVNTLFDADQIVENFSGMDRAFLTVPVSRGGLPTSQLTYGPETDLADIVLPWADARSVTSLVVLKDGEIAHDEYYQGTSPADLRISWSVAKSYLSALMGTVVAAGEITSLDDPVTDYAPLLKGSAYDGVSIRNVLNMASGVTFDEDYLDKSSDINRMGRVLALGGSMDAFAADLSERFAPAGEQWRYVSIDTHVLGMVIRGATGRSIPELMSERIIAPMGLEYAPYYLTDGEGVAFVLGGLNMTTRDHARMGQMVLQNGRWNERQIVPADWIAQSTAPSAPTAPGDIQYGYQWWIPADATEGEIFARGIYGQYIYINRPAGVVIATTAADRDFREAGVHDQNLATFRALTEALQ